MSITYRLTCMRPLPAGAWRGLSEHHQTLGAALEALLDHQQRRWTQITLTPLAYEREKAPTPQLTLFND